MRKIVKLVAYFHNAFDVRIFQREARSLAKAGYQVKIIVPHSQSEIRDGIEIIALPQPQNKYDKIFGSALKTLIAGLKQDRDVVFHVHDHKVLFVGYILRLLGWKVVYDGHEDLPLHISYQHWIPKLIKPFYWLFFRILEWCAPFVLNGVIVSEPLITRHFPKSRAIPIQTFPDIADFQVDVPKFEKPAVVYIGLLSQPRGIENILEALDHLNESMDFDFHFAGKVAPEGLMDLIADRPYLKYHGFLPLDQTYKLMKASHVAIYLPNMVKRYTINRPIKVYEYLAAGLPMVTYDFGFPGEIVRELNWGIAVEYGDNRAASKALMTILQNPGLAQQMSDSALENVYKRYSWDREAEKLFSFYDNIYRSK